MTTSNTDRERGTLAMQRPIYSSSFMRFAPKHLRMLPDAKQPNVGENHHWSKLPWKATGIQKRIVLV